MTPRPSMPGSIRPRSTGAARSSRTRCAEGGRQAVRSEEHTSELQSLTNLVCRLLLEKKKEPLDVRRDKQTQNRRRTIVQHTPCLSPHVMCIYARSIHTSLFFFSNDPPTTEIYPLSLHDALPICLMDDATTFDARVYQTEVYRGSEVITYKVRGRWEAGC